MPVQTGLILCQFLSSAPTLENPRCWPKSCFLILRPWGPCQGWITLWHHGACPSGTASSAAQGPGAAHGVLPACSGPATSTQAFSQGAVRGAATQLQGGLATPLQLLETTTKDKC